MSQLSYISDLSLIDFDSKYLPYLTDCVSSLLSDTAFNFTSLTSTFESNTFNFFITVPGVSDTLSSVSVRSTLVSLFESYFSAFIVEITFDDHHQDFLVEFRER